MYIPTSPQTILSIENSPTALKAYPNLSVGDIVRIAILESNSNGAGLIELGIQRLNATLPPNLKQGDQLLAKVTQLHDAVVLKLLDVTQSNQLNQSTEQVILTKNINHLPKIPLNNYLLPYQLPIELLTNTTSEKITTTLKDLVAGQLPLKLKDFASVLAKSNILFQVKDGIKELQNQLPNLTPFDLKETFNSFTEQITRQINNTKNLPSSNKQTFTELITQLRQPFSNTETAKIALENILKTVDTQIKQTSKETQINFSETTKIASQQLEQLASAQQTLNQLNPVMHSFGDPAFLLFPFLIQGFFSQAQITVESRTGGKQKKQQNNKQSKQIQDAKGYQRIYINVPLPSMGLVGVDIAYRDREILLRLTVEDQEAAEFLENRLENLASILRSQGFDKTELSTNRNQPQEKIPEWVEILSMHTSVVA